MSIPLPRLALLGILAGAACSSQDGGLGPGHASPSRAYGIWQPGSHDSCTREQHDAYAVIGPDGKAYPAWHPPTGPGGCSFGHEHGRDPRGSDLYEAAGGVPFGYANEMLATTDPANLRDEDHVGHKIEWENDLQLPFLTGNTAGGVAICDVLYKLHQGTHSKDALTNNLHELVYHLRCEDGTSLHVTFLAAIGRPGQFARACTQSEFIDVGPATPANSPIGFGSRHIPDRTCVERHMLVPDGQLSVYSAALQETWRTFNTIERADGQAVAFFDPYFTVSLPSRFYDPATAPEVGRPMHACYEESAGGEHASGGACAIAAGAPAPIPYDDPRSPFNGAARSIELNVTQLFNAGGPEAWYTDPFGKEGRAAPFPGSIRQAMSRTNRNLGLVLVGPSIGADRDYGGSGVRSPN
jgi:hypothetical protein